MEVNVPVVAAVKRANSICPTPLLAVVIPAVEVFPILSAKTKERPLRKPIMRIVDKTKIHKFER
jgi:hypothetical protein